MQISNISYPHPVLGNGDDVSQGKISPDVKYEISDEVIHIFAENLVTDHPDLDRMLANGHASWHVRVQCSRTYMRENYVCKGPTWSVRLNGEDYEGTVTVDIVVVASDEVREYTPTGLHEDYGEEKFHVREGEVLAIGPTFRFHIDKIYDPLNAPVASLVRIDEGENTDGPFKLTLDDDLITVRLSKSDWQEYPGIRDRAPSIVHSAIVLPTLADAISKLEEYTDTLWGGRLRDILDAREIDAKEPLQAAQEILASPVSRTFSEVNITLDKGDR